LLWAGLSGWNSDGGNDEETVSSLASAALAPSLLQGLQGTGNPLSGRMVALDGDVVRLIAYGADWRDSLRFRAAGGILPGNQAAALARGSEVVLGGVSGVLPSGIPEEVLDANPYLEPATWLITIYCCEGDPGGAYCGATASGVQVAEGMAACSTHWPFGTRFQICGGSIQDWRVVTCQDRGSAVVSRKHLDVHFADCGDQQDPAPGTGWAWLAEVGTQAVVEVVRCQD